MKNLIALAVIIIVITLIYKSKYSPEADQKRKEKEKDLIYNAKESKAKWRARQESKINAELQKIPQFGRALFSVKIMLKLNQLENTIDWDVYARDKAKGINSYTSQFELENWISTINN